MSNAIKIGTRDSKLASWQANQVSTKLQELGYSTEIKFIKSEGDLDLTTPLSEMGGKGVFTKALDTALLNGEIDIAVHSLKDLPTDIDLPITIPAVLKREDPRDVLVSRNIKENDFADKKLTIATGSLRRKSQWLNKYNHHNLVDLRGNVITRLKKIDDNNWDGAIFAAAGLKRIGLDGEITHYLEWMIPAPAQGAIAAATAESNKELTEIVSNLNHDETSICTSIERELLNVMEAGCSAPVGAYAEIKGSKIEFSAIALMPDGTQRYEINESVELGDHEGFGSKCAKILLDRGADKIIEFIKQ